jgi:hypothetical protein
MGEMGSDPDNSMVKIPKAKYFLFEFVMICNWVYLVFCPLFTGWDTSSPRMANHAKCWLERLGRQGYAAIEFFQKYFSPALALLPEMYRCTIENVAS